MPPKRRARAPKSGSQKPNSPSSPDQKHTSPYHDDNLEHDNIKVSNQPTELPTEPLTPEEIQMPEPPPETDEEMPEETEHIIGETGKVTKHGFAGGYNALKSHKGQYYSGMAVGGSHTWNYDPGVWKETKEEPDLWRIDYRTNKRRARNAPKGSGAPVGTEYHWLIVGHQVCVFPLALPPRVDTVADIP